MRLDKETAQKFLDNPEQSTPFRYCSEITEEAAELLVEKHHGELDLTYLTNINKASAAILGAFEGDLLLDGCKDLSPDILEEFSERSCESHHYLGLNGLTNLDDYQAMALSSFHGKLGLSGITSISNKCAEIIGSGKACQLYFDGLEEITEAALKHILGCRGRYIVSLDGLVTLPEIRSDWSSLQGNLTEIYLNGLICATYESLKKVVSVASEAIYLNSIDHLPQEEGLFENGPWQLFLGGLKKITKLDILNFGLKKFVELDGLEEIDVECARLLAASCVGCSLSVGLRKMSDEVASELMQPQSEFFFMKRLEELTPFAAEVCGRFMTLHDINFPGLHQISDEAFELLLADYTNEEEGWCHGSFWLTGIQYLTPRMRKALEDTKHSVTLGKILE